LSVPVKRTVGAMSAFGATALLFGAVQAVVIARAFGTERTYDLYLLVAVIPEVMIFFTQNLIAALVLPFFHRWEEKMGEAGAWRELWNVFNLIVVGYAILTVLVILNAGFIVNRVIPGSNAKEIAEAVLILRLLAPIIATSLCLRVFFSIHNARGKFIFPSFTNVVQPIIITASVFIFASKIGVYSIAVGALSASIVQAGLLAVAVLKGGARYWRPTLNVARPPARVFLAAAVPLAAGAAAEQLNTFIDRNVAARLTEGAVSSLKYGFTIMGFASAVFSIPLARVSYTYFSRDAAGERTSDVARRLERSLTQLAVFYVPASVGLFILAEPAIGFLFYGGQFGAESLGLTVAATRAYAVGLLFFTALGMVRAAAYGLQRYWFFSTAAVAAIGLTVAADILFANWLGHWGIALARGFVNALWVLAVLWYLGARSGVGLTRATLVSIIKVIAASAIMAVLVWWLYGIAWDAGIPGRLGYLVRLIYPTAGGAVAYAVLTLAFKVEPVSDLADSIVRRFKREKPAGG
jgi:putative peptidoglycan lipid II flippase